MAKTNADGKYSLEEILCGESTLRVSAPGYATYQIKIYMLSDTQTKLHFKLKKRNAPAKE